jgi:hypothetical protein
MRRYLVPVALAGTVLLMLAVLLAGYSVRNGRRSACDSRNATASLFHDVIVIASQPAKGEKPKPLTASQKQRLHLIFARIDLIRC